VEGCLQHQSGDASPGNRKRDLGQRFQAFELDADVARAQLQVTGSHLNAFSLGANHKLSFALKETLVKLEVPFVDIGNYDDVDIPGTFRGQATLVEAPLESRNTRTGVKERPVRSRQAIPVS
jgi:hypothetical protein